MSEDLYFLTDAATHELMLEYTSLTDMTAPTKYSGLTLGAYRRGRHPRVSPGGVVQFWSPCARMISALTRDYPLRPGEELTWPHAYHMVTRGTDEFESFFCPQCKSELAAHHLSIGTVSKLTLTPVPQAPPKRRGPKINPNQGSLF